MQKRTKLLLMLFALAFLMGGKWFSSGSVIGSKSPHTPGSLEEKARKAESGNEDDVRDLADEVFYRYGQMMPAEVANGIKERVVRAEMEYKKSRKGGVAGVACRPCSKPPRGKV